MVRRGQNEVIDAIESLRAGDRNVYLLANSVTTVDGPRVAGFSGNDTPTWYECLRNDLEGDRRRHFTREDIERAAALADIDVLLAHEGPTGLLYYGYEPGCEYVNGLLEALSPSLCLIGHHHRHREGEITGTRVVSLAPAWERYYTLSVDAGEPILEGHDHDHS